MLCLIFNGYSKWRDFRLRKVIIEYIVEIVREGLEASSEHIDRMRLQ